MKSLIVVGSWKVSNGVQSVSCAVNQYILDISTPEEINESIALIQKQLTTTVCNRQGWNQEKVIQRWETVSVNIVDF